MSNSQAISKPIITEIKTVIAEDEIDNKYNFMGVALIATALKLGLDINSWAKGYSISLDWANRILDVNKLHYFNILIEKLDSWPTDRRENIIRILKNTDYALSDFFADLRLYSETSNTSKQRGSILTPSWLAKRVVKEALGHWKRLHRTGKLPRVVVDTSCGVGTFLDEYLNVFGSAETLIGIDIDEEAIFYAELLGRAQEKKWKVYCADSLKWFPQQRTFNYINPSKLREGQVDLLLGNPPYVRSQLLNREYARELSSLYPTVTGGNFDLVVLFIDQALRLLAPGGIASYIISSKFIASKYGKEISRRLANEARLINFTDFGDSQLFKGKVTYTCVLTFAKLPPTKRFTVTKFLNGFEQGKELGKGQSFTLPTERLNKHPWVFTEGEQDDAFKKIQASENPQLMDIFDDVLQGVRTGANNVFVIPNDIVNDLETELLVPFVTGEDIRRMRCDANRQSLIFPYILNGDNRSRLISEEEVNKYPKIKNYLLERKQILQERVFDNESGWYGYSRNQNLDVLRLPKVLLREMMPRAEVALDVQGNVTFSSGYGLIARNMPGEELILWTAILNTPIMEFALRKLGTQLHSGWYRLLKHHLLGVRLPILKSKKRIKALELAKELYDDPSRIDAWQQLDDIVASSFGLKESERESIYKMLEHYHARSLSSEVRDDTSIYKTNSVIAVPNSSKYEPVKLEQYDRLHIDREDLRQFVTFNGNKELPIHRWYPYTQGFSKQLVDKLIEELGVQEDEVILDPFTGVGTTNLVSKTRGIRSVGFDISPLIVFLARVKTHSWNPNEIQSLINSIIGKEKQILAAATDLSEIPFNNYLRKAFSPLILRQLICISTFINTSSYSSLQRQFLMTGLVGIMEEVSNIRKHGSHYRFMNADENIGLQKLNIQLIPPDSNILPVFFGRLNLMLEDIQRHSFGKNSKILCEISEGDSRSLPLADRSVNIVITSPPYLNRNNYINQQKAELAFTGLVKSKDDYLKVVNSSIHSHVDGNFPEELRFEFPEIKTIVEAITLSHNNNPKIPNMVAEYFYDMGQTLKELSRIVAPGGRCAFVVGNSRWGGIVVPVDHILMMIAESYGFAPDRILVTRLKGNSPQQMRQYGRIPVRESIIVFHKS